MDGAVITTVNADEVAVRAVGVPESVILKVMSLYVPAHDAVGAVPEVVVRMPPDLRVRHVGSVVPLPRAQV